MTTADREAAIDELPPTTPSRAARRHPAQVTADRIVEHVADYTDHLTPAEMAVLLRAQSALLAVPHRLAADRAEASE